MSLWNPRLSLSSKLILGMLLCLTIPGALLVIFLPLHEAAVIERGTLEKLRDMCRSTALYIAPAIDFDMRESVNEHIRALVDFQEIRQVRVYGSDDQIYAIAGEAGGPPTPPSLLEEGSPGPVRRGHDLVVAAPIESGEQRLGTIVVLATDRYIREAVAKERWVLLLLIGLTLLVGSGLAMLLGRYFARPILQIKEAAEAVANGDFSKSVTTRSRDEIGATARAFNEMTERLRQTTEGLQDLNATLEQRVERRTRELAEAKEIAEETARALTEKNEVVRLIHQITLAANEAGDLEQACAAVLAIVTGETQWSCGVAYQVSEESGRLRTVAVCADEAHATGLRAILESPREVAFGADDSPRVALETAAPVWVHELAAEPSPRARQLASKVGLRSSLCLPIFGEDKVKGVLELFSERPCEEDRVLPESLDAIDNQLGRVYDRSRAEGLRESLSTQMLETSRKAGMAEVATGVLHNVGNVLNSVNVSISLLSAELNRPDVSNLARAANLLERNLDRLEEYLRNDPKGKVLPTYIIKLGRQIARQRDHLLAEITEVEQHVSHIKEIVSTQQDVARTSGVEQKLAPAEAMEDALRLRKTSLARYDIRVVREYEEVAPISVDPHMLKQILINFVSNAEHALATSRQSDRQLVVRIRGDEDSVYFEVEDNGVGISRENQRRIFQHGFTTKKGGHGFGLHHSALAARDLGGAVTFDSAGVGQGACFMLTMPLTNRSVETSDAS